MKLSEQIANKIYPVLEGNRHQSSERLNLALAEELDPVLNRPVELLIKLMNACVPNTGNMFVFDEVRKYLETVK